MQLTPREPYVSLGPGDRGAVPWLVIDGEPVPWARAGRRGGRTYTPRRYAEHLELVGWSLRHAHPGPPLQAELGVRLRFYRGTARPVDLDNLAKAVLDAGTGIVWADDRQVHRLEAELHLDRARPRTEVAVYDLAAYDAARG